MYNSAMRLLVALLLCSSIFAEPTVTVTVRDEKACSVVPWMSHLCKPAVLVSVVGSDSAQVTVTVITDHREIQKVAKVEDGRASVWFNLENGESYAGYRIK